MNQDGPLQARYNDLDERWNVLTEAERNEHQELLDQMADIEDASKHLPSTVGMN